MGMHGIIAFFNITLCQINKDLEVGSFHFVISGQNLLFLIILPPKKSHDFSLGHYKLRSSFPSWVYIQTHAGGQLIFIIYYSLSLDVVQTTNYMIDPGQHGK